jgi:hypothetical protein
MEKLLFASFAAALLGLEPVREKIETREALAKLWPALLLRRRWCARTSLSLNQP